MLELLRSQEKSDRDAKSAKYLYVVEESAGDCIIIRSIDVCRKGE